LIKLFSTGTEKDKNMWYWDNKPICSVCEELINDTQAAFIVDWDKKKGRIDNLIHMNCLKKYCKSPLSVAQYRLSVLLTDVIPPKSTPVFINNPSFSPSKNNISTFEFDKIHSDKTTDNAWRSKKFPSIKGAVIGDQEALKQNLDRDKEIEADPFAFLKEQKKLSKKAALQHKKKNLIGENK